MKRLLIVSLAVLVLAAVMPQPAAAGFGVKGGWSQSKLKYSDVGAPDLNTRKTFTGGAFWNFSLGIVSIQPEVMYTPMGARMEEGADWMESRLDYIQVPVLVKVSFIPGPFSPTIYAGPYGSYLISAKGVSSIGGVSDSVDISDVYTSTDYGFVFGGGIDFKLVAIKISLEARYNLGMANIAKDPEEGYSIKNESLMFLVGLSF